MQRVHLVVLLLLALVVVSPQLLREYPLGMDSYYYLHHAGDPQPGFPPLFFHLAEYDTVAISFLFAFLTLSTFYLICNHLGAVNPLLPPLLLLAAPGLTFRMALFEDDLAGVFLGLLAILFYLKSEEDKRWWFGIVMLAPMFLIAWRGLALFFGLIIFNEIVKRCRYAWALLPLLYLQFTPDTLVGEHSWGFIFAPIVLLGLLTGLKGWRQSRLFLKTWSAFFLVLGMFQAKWLWLAAFPLAIMLWETIRDEPRQKVETLLIILIGIGFFIGAQMVIQSQPTSQQILDVKEIVEVTGGSVDNSWQFGHWIRWAGGEPLNDNLNPVDAIPPDGWDGEWALSHEPLLGLDMYKNFTWSVLYRRQASPVSSSSAHP